MKQILATTEERRNKQVEKIPGPGFPFRIFWHLTSFSLQDIFLNEVDVHFVCKMSDTHCYRNKKVSLVCTLDTFWQLLRHKFFLSEEPKVTFVINPYITLKFLENSQCFKASPLVLCIYCKINAARESRAKSIKTRTIVLLCSLQSKLWTRLYLGKPKYFSIYD